MLIFAEIEEEVSMTADVKLKIAVKEKVRNAVSEEVKIATKEDAIIVAEPENCRGGWRSKNCGGGES